MRKSKKISLVLLGTAGLSSALTGCSEDVNRVTEQAPTNYASKEDCKREWKDDEACTRSSKGGYLGPRYFYNHGTGAASALYANGVTKQVPTSAVTANKSLSKFSQASTTRTGGFGSTGRSGSSGG